MAITFVNQPDSDYKYPAWNDINYTITSSNTTEDGFKVVAKVYVSTLLKQTYNLYVYPDTTRAYLNINKVVQNFITDDYEGKKASPSIANSQTLNDVYVTFQEYYDGSLQGSLATSDTIYCWRSAFPPVFMKDLDFNRWQLYSGLSANDSELKMLTGFANVIEGTQGITPPTIALNSNILKIREGQRFYLRFIRDSTAISLNAQIRIGLYDSDGLQTHSDVKSMVGLSNTDMQSFSIGTDDLDDHSWLTGFTLDSDDKYLALEITEQTYSETYNYLFEYDWTPCNAYETFEVHWLNRYGGFDSWVFDRNSNKQINVIQESHKVNPFDITSPTYDPSSRYVKPHFTQLSETIEMNTQNLKAWEYQGLRDLFTSPEIYVKVATEYSNYFVSAVVLDNQVVQRKRTQDGIFNVNVKLKIDNSEQRQW